MDLGIHKWHTVSSESLKGPAVIALPRGGDAYWFLVNCVKYRRYSRPKCIQVTDSYTNIFYMPTGSITDKGRGVVNYVAKRFCNDSCEIKYCS